MSDFSQIVFGGVAIMPLALGLTQFFKTTFGLEGAPVTRLSMLIGVILFTCGQLATMYPVFGEWFAVAVFGLGGGLAASGLYRMLPHQSAEDDGLARG